MRKTFQLLAMSALLLTPATTARAQVSFGITFGAPPAPKAYRVPAQPGPDYDFIEGYWYPEGSKYKWHDGYWTRPPYQGAYLGRAVSCRWQVFRGPLGRQSGQRRA